MPTDSLQTSESIVFDGTVTLTTAIVIGFVLAAIAAWLLYRERQSVGPRWAGLFWLMRMTAIGVALWMLSGPVHETIERSTVSQSIAILADASQSMDTVDVPDPTDLMRWTLAGSAKDEVSELARCDRIKVALRLADRSCERAVTLLNQHRPLKELKQAVEEVRVAASRAQEHCDQLVEKLGEDREDFAERVGRIQTLLQGPIDVSLSDVQEALDDRGASLVGKMTDSLDALTDHFSAAVRRIDTLTRELAQDLTDEGPC